MTVPAAITLVCCVVLVILNTYTALMNRRTRRLNAETNRIIEGIGARRRATSEEPPRSDGAR